VEEIMSIDQLSRYIPDTTIGIVGGSTSIVLGNANIVAGLIVATVSTIVLVLRYLDHRQKHKLEIKKLEEDLKILKGINEIDPRNEE
jgi:capsular polysaccharide biosynthesis protein